MLPKNLSGKTAIITGASKGMGYEISLALAARKARVIMADKVDQSQSRNDIHQKTCNEEICTQHLDLRSFKCVRDFAKNVLDSEERLDVLINNAGVFCLDKCRTEDGLDGIMQVNHLGPFLLTHLLVELLRKSERSRVVFVTSRGSFFHNMDVGKLTEPDYYEPHYVSGAIHYYNSKLCNMITSKILAKNLRGSNVTSNSVHPGMASTDFLVSSAGTLKKSLTMKVLKCLTRDVKDAAAQTVFMATSDSIRGVTGKYFADYQVAQEPKVLEDEDYCRQVWEKSVKLTDLDQRKCTEM